MQISSGSSFVSTQSYSNMDSAFNQTGITYKSNQTLHRLAEERPYPYILLLHTTKIYHFNQFEVIFFSHILYEYEPSYQEQPEIFQHDLEHPIIQKAYDNLTLQRDQNSDHFTIKDVTNMYTYLMVIGYSVKYYLNQSVKSYEEEIKRIHPDFFTNIFNSWAEKYGNKVLKTNPKKINSFYINIFQSEDVIQNAEIDCQYRNYNQIVQQLLKATTQIEVHQKIDEMEG